MPSEQMFYQNDMIRWVASSLYINISYQECSGNIRTLSSVEVQWSVRKGPLCSVSAGAGRVLIVYFSRFPFPKQLNSLS